MVVNRNEEEFTESLPEKIAKYIIEEMFVGNLKQGDRLVEATIAKKLNVSHAPVREALYILEMKNVVERFPRKGVRIRVIDDKEIKDYIEALVGIVQLSSQSIGKWTEEMYSELEEIYNHAQKELENENIREYVQTVADFFSVFVQFTNNTVYQHFTSEILFVTNVFAKTQWNQALINKFQAQLTSAIEALKEKDLHLAGIQMGKTIWITLDGIE